MSTRCRPILAMKATSTEAGQPQVTRGPLRVAADDNLSPHRRRLGKELRQLREAADVSGRQMAADLGWSQPKISRSERGLNVPPLADVGRWLDSCHASDHQKRALLALADTVATEVVTNR